MMGSILLSLMLGQVVTVDDTVEFRAALASAEPGMTIAVQPGRYEGGLNARGLRGEPGRPIRIVAADSTQPPVIVGGGSGLQLSAIAHVELEGLTLEGASGNGLNIDDGGAMTEPSHHVVLRKLVVRDVGPRGNSDGIKLSGVDQFRVEDCRIERWGDGGSGIDMVGCHQGEIVGCELQHERGLGGNGVQAKGSCAEVAIRRCRFEDAGQRAVQLGGSTGLAFFRPKVQGYEARELLVEDCWIAGSDAAVAFVGVDGAVVRHNTIEEPRRWVFRVLQETTGEEFVPSRNGVITDNVIAFRSDAVREAFNVGPGTAIETFQLEGNVWTCLDNPERSQLRLPEPVTEVGGVYGSALERGGDEAPWLKPQAGTAGIRAQ